MAQTDVAARVDQDPIRFARRYTNPTDIEVAALVAAVLAFGRVSLFGPVLETIFTRMDQAGGPRRFVDAYGSTPVFPTLRYRWVAPDDFHQLFGMLRDTLRAHGHLADIFPAGTAAHTLDQGVTALRAHAPNASRSLRSLLPSPSDGSACKRLCMMLRWLVRTEAPDLGLWRHLDPAALVIPLDTHVYRVAHFIGLTRRASAGWRTAEEITRALAALDPRDPTRYDFALAHLGISGACLGHRDADVCPGCPLDRVCTAAPKARPGTSSMLRSRL